MNKHFLNNNNLVTAVLVVLFMVLPCSFKTYACKASCQQTVIPKETEVQAEKKLLLPALTPLQMISSKFM